MEPQPPQDLDEYSASSTIITFDRPIPLLRGPVLAGPLDDPSAGPHLLAFRSARAWQSAYNACESKIIQQCEAGSRIGCAISASSKCKPPWWHALIRWNKGLDLKEREECQDREMEACLAVAKEKCVGFAKDKCLKPFMDARVVVGEKRLRENEVRNLVYWASMANSSCLVDLIKLDGDFSRCVFGAGVYRASELFRFDNDCDKQLSKTSCEKD